MLHQKSERERGRALHLKLEKRFHSSITIALLQIFTIIGPPMILQSDNGAEFHGAAINDRQQKNHGNLVTLTNNELAAIITRNLHSLFCRFVVLYVNGQVTIWRSLRSQ